MINIIKKIYEKLPKFIKFAFSKIFIKLMINNKEFKKTWDELDKFENLSTKEKKKYQFNKLKETLIYSYENVPYYKEVFDKYKFDPYNIKKSSDINKIPILTKEEAIKLEDKLYSKKNIHYYTSYTGGSSGKTLKVLLDKDSIYKERAVVTHYLSKFGYDLNKSRTLIFRGHNFDKDFYYSPLKNEIAISPFRLLDEKNFDNIIKIIKDYNPDFLIGYSSSLYIFAKLVDKYNIDINFKKIIYISENMNKEDKNFIENVFNTKLLSFYGHNERSCFGYVNDYECEFLDYYGYTELVKSEIEDEYKIVCSGFFNKKMPLIRYETDDIIKIINNKRILVGHRGSEIYLLDKNKNKIFQVDLFFSIKELNKSLYYQFIQNDIGKAEFHIIENEKLLKSDLKKIKEYLDRRCEGLLDIEIKIVDSIKLTPKGKYIWAINNIKKNL